MEKDVRLVSHEDELGFAASWTVASRLSNVVSRLGILFTSSGGGNGLVGSMRHDWTTTADRVHAISHGDGAVIALIQSIIATTITAQKSNSGNKYSRLLYPKHERPQEERRGLTVNSVRQGI